MHPSTNLTTNLSFEQPHAMLPVNSCQLPYWKVGQGPDLVFVHGWPLDSRTWRNVLPMLSKHYTCHLFNLPGTVHATTPKAYTPSIKEYGDIVAAAIRAMDLPGRFGIVAHDSGGSFTRLAVPQLGDDVCGLVFGNTEIPGHHPWRLKNLFWLAKTKQGPAIIQHLAARRLGQYLLLRDSIADTTRAQRELVPRFIQPLVNSPELLRGALLLPKHNNVPDFDIIGATHATIKCPIRLIWGARDPYFPINKCRAMMNSFGGPIDLKIIDDAKLLVHEEAPADFAMWTHEHVSSLSFGHHQDDLTTKHITR